MKYGRFSTSLLLAALCAACGGSSDEDEAFGDFAGVWFGTANITETTCPITGYEYGIYFTHLVSQVGTKVVIDNGASAFDGTAGPDSFNGTQQRGYAGELLGVANCIETITWRYEAVEKDVSQFVVRNSSISCSSGSKQASCATTFTGSANRNGNPYPIPVEPDIGYGDGIPAAERGQAVSDTEL